MWPWEHAAVGYVAFSVLVHAVARRSPTGPEAVTVVFAAALPDLVDKPLAWEFGVFPSGYGLAHSVFFAVPLAAVVGAIARTVDRASVGVAFATGYLLHLPGDLLPSYVRRGRVPTERVLWPVETAETSYPGGFFGTFSEYFKDYVAEFTSGGPSGYVVSVTGLVGLCVLLWLYDGAPGLREPIAYARARGKKMRQAGRPDGD